MRENGTTSEKSTSKRIKDFLYQLYWEQVALQINYTVFFFNLKVFKRHLRSKQSLIIRSSKRIDAKGEIEKMERGRNNMQEFVKIVPDECLIELSEKVYCVSKRL